METRKHPRMNIDLKITSEIDKDSQQKFSLAGGKNFEVNAVDISKSGIGLTGGHFLPQGLIIELRIDGAFFGLRSIMTIKGEIRYCRYVKSSVYRYGVRFINTFPKYEKAIGKFISTHERRRDPRLKLSD